MNAKLAHNRIQLLAQQLHQVLGVCQRVDRISLERSDQGVFEPAAARGVGKNLIDLAKSLMGLKIFGFFDLSHFWAPLLLTINLSAS